MSTHKPTLGHFFPCQHYLTRFYGYNLSLLQHPSYFTGAKIDRLSRNIGNIPRKEKIYVSRPRP